MEDNKTLIAVLRSIANSIKSHSGIKEEDYETNPIAPNEFYERILSFSEHTFAPNMVDVSGEGFSIVKNLIIDGTIKEVGNGAFESSNITSVTFEDGVETILANAFNDCDKLVNINWGKVSTIKDSSFQYCNALKEINITKYMTTITNRAFFSSSNVVSISVAEDNPTYKSEGNCIISKIDYLLNNNNTNIVANTLIQGCKTSEIPDYIVGIGGSAFAGDLSPSSVSLPVSVTSIGNYAFQNCSNLKTITMGDNITTIGAAAFISCGFTEIVLSAGLSSLGSNALSNYNCSIFDFSRCDVDNPPTLGGKVFGDTHPKDGWKIIVPKGALSFDREDEEANKKNWDNKTGWANYAEVMEEAT